MKGKRDHTPFAKKSLGQNFLSDTRLIDNIVVAANPGKNDLIIEIGPGRGAITDQLVNSGATVIAIELDRNLISPLNVIFHGKENFKIIEADALEIDFTALVKEAFEQNPELKRTKVVANLPYYISTAILQKLASYEDLFSELILMFQREVVDRITAKPGSSERGYLTVLIESTFRVEKLFDVPPEAFIPRPKVWSSVARLVPDPSEINDPEHFKKLISAGFAQKRKTILNNLKGDVFQGELILSIAGIDPKVRAEALTLDEWISLSNAAITKDQIT